MSGESGTAAPRSLTGRILASYRDMRGETRALIDARQPESRLLVLAMLSGVFWFLGSIGALWLDPAMRGSDTFAARTGAEFVSALVWRTLGLYLVAGALHLGARAFRGSGDGNATRTGFFWAALVAAPAMLAARLIAAVIPAQGPLIELVGAGVFAWLAALGLAEAHQFRRPLLILAVFAASVTLSAVFLKLLLGF